jgi:hypothetical protein
VVSVAFSSDGLRVFARALPQRPEEQGVVLAWDVRTGALVAASSPPPLPANQLFARHQDRQLTARASGTCILLRSVTSDSPEARARRADDNFQDTVFWHHRQASSAEAAGDWFAALFHLDRLRHLQCDRASPRPARARLVPSASDKDGRDVPALLARARLALDTGAAADYRAVCAALVKESGPHRRAVAWTCALGPGAVADLGPLLQAADKDAAGKDHAALRTHGALLLRAGRHAEALKRLDEALQERGPHATPVEELLLGITSHNLGHKEDAQRWLARARLWLEAPRAARLAGHGLSALPGTPLAAPPGLGIDAPDPRELLFGWQAWLDVLILRREAETLLAMKG